MIKILKQDTLKRDDAFSSSAPANVTEIVSGIINDVATRGDEALFEYCEKFDKCKLTSLAVTKEEIENAFEQVEPEFLEILKEAAENIRVFHKRQVKEGFIQTNENGSVVGQRVIPLEKVGLYVPGGTAAYPSTVLMDAIPAKVAGCKEIVIVTPPDKEGKVNPAILAAAYIAGVDKIFKVGGAQAVAALAYGTESVPRVDKIAGPGNMYVAEAKRQVYGRVDIDMIAGPSEILIVADGKSDARIIAADLLSQAEHDKNASAVLVTDSEELANNVSNELERQIALLPREEIARTSIDNNGLIIVTSSIDVAIEIADEIAPEHLELSVDEPFSYLGKVKNAGSVFLGRYCPEALGDYFAGPNHTLPTSGTARFSSPLSVDDFVKKSQYIYYTKDALNAVYKKVAAFAEKEGLSAHARSARARFEKF
ncbi:MAG: histidinol dehydrogenase [Ruminococcaceae bacterium]|nr:histidinol dehydrogenase [Oscillospiraceae bacterium]